MPSHVPSGATLWRRPAVFRDDDVSVAVDFESVGASARIVAFRERRDVVDL